MGKKEEHRKAVEEIVRRISGDPAAVDLVRDVERLVRFELDKDIPEDERLASQFLIPRLPPVRRTALISDIHGNRAGLMAALADMESQDCNRIVCLGDLVEGGPDDEGVIEVIRSRGIPTVRGNHDVYNDVDLTDRSRHYLRSLPERIVMDDVLFIHISPRVRARKVTDEVEAWNVFDECKFRLIFIGHVHVPHIFGEHSESFGQATDHPFEYNQPFVLSLTDRYVVSVGSLGYGRDGIGKLRYAIYDHTAGTVQLRAVSGPVLPMDHAL